MIGYGSGRRFELGAFVVEPGGGLQNGWCTLTLTALDSERNPPQRWLLTATGAAENTDMVWKSPEKNSVGRQWGRAPSRIEGVAARIQVAGATVAECWALDERGQRRDELPREDGHTVVIGPDWRTLWYELALR